MGNTPPSASGQRVTGDDFETVQLIGKGAFGKVWQVRKKDSGTVYALKVLDKADVVQEDLVAHTKGERDILLSVVNPFIVNLHYAFQTDEKLCFVLDYVGGGSLFDLLQCTDRGYLLHDEVRFFAAEILLGLEALHAHNIIYRDMKLENVLLSAQGHAVLTDFGLSKQLKKKQKRVQSFSGTAIYLAPEILKDKEGKGHGKSVDWWAFGVLLHVLLTGTPPFWSENKKELFDMIVSQDALLDDELLPPSAQSLLRGLLTRDVAKRLGCGREAVRDHDFFQGIDWSRFMALQVEAPLKPAFDVAQVTRDKFADERLDVGQKNKEDRRFRGFSYIGQASPLDNLTPEQKQAWAKEDEEAKKGLGSISRGPTRAKARKKRK